MEFKSEEIEIQKMDIEKEEYSDGEVIKPLCIDFNKSGLKSETSVLFHVAKENLYNSNAISDISDVSYIENSKGLMCATPLDEFPPFFDDIYIGGYVFEDEIKERKEGGYELKTFEDLKKEKGDDLEINEIAPSILNLNYVKDDCEHYFARSCKKTKIYSTPGIYEKSKDNKFIVNRVSLKNRFNGGGILRNAQLFKKKKNEKQAAVVAVKVDISNIPYKIILENLKQLDKSLMRKGFLIFQIDVTRDLLGTLDPDALYYFFLDGGWYREEEEKAPLSYYDEEDGEFYESDFEEWKEKMVLLDREKVKKRSGNQIIKFVRNEGNTTVNGKYYNKIVSNLEAGNTQKKLGAHLAELIYNPDDPYLQRLFHERRVIECGVTRLELSIFSLKLDENYEKLTEEEFNKIKNEKIFHVQPIAQHWLNLASKIDRSALICDKTQRTIFMAQYGSIVTGRVAGNFYTNGKDYKNETEERFLKRWEKAKKEAIAEFGYNLLPVNVIEYEIKTEGQKKK